MVKNQCNQFNLCNPSLSAPLALFRIMLGLLLFGSVVRFWLKGWIEDLYITPHYFFSYYGFEFIQPLGQYTYLLFAICGISALLVAVGYYYRLAIISLFLSFTYIELMDKSTYLNHYYFVSLVCFLLIFLPANSYFSLDAKLGKTKASAQLPAWTTNSIKLLITILYLHAGLAKVNSDWLLHAQPLKLWLPGRNDLPLIGWLLNYPWVAFVFSWFGCLYDLFIAFFLWNKRTFWRAYLAVIVFHILTSILFPIGMFPYIMIGIAFIFCPEETQQNIINKLASFFKTKPSSDNLSNAFALSPLKKTVLIAFFLANILVPWRYLLYPGELFWTEEGFRFSWRVMLMEKTGFAQFTVKDNNGKVVVVENSNFLTPLQEKMMATQPDMMVQYAKILKQFFEKQGFSNPKVYVDSYVSLNGRLGKSLVDPTVNLAKEHDTFAPKKWILPLNDDIAGI